MPKLSTKPLGEEKIVYLVNNVWTVFLSIKTREEMRTLFRDLFTHTEYKMFAKRLEIARRLLGGEQYDDIRHGLNVSEKTIANISNILAQSGNGFRKAHNDLKNFEENFSKKKSNPFRRKFPRYKGSPHLSEIINIFKK